MVGDLTTDDGLDLRAWEYRAGRSCITPWASAKFTVAATDHARALAGGEDVKFYRRRVGDDEWKAPWFVGYLETPHPLRDKPHLRLTCKGQLALLRRRERRGLTYSGTLEEVLENWAYAHASDWLDDVDIQVTEPVAFPKSIMLTAGSPLDILKAVRRFAAVHIRIREDVGGKRVLEVRDEVEPSQAAWDALTDDGCKLRTFGAPGRPRPGADYPTAELYPKLEGDWDGVAVLGPDGTMVAQAGMSADLYVDTGGIRGDAQGYAQALWDAVREPRRCGWLSLAGIMQDADNAPYGLPNDIIRLRHNKRGTGGLYAVQRVWWAQARDAGPKGKWQPATLTLVLADRIHKVYIPQAMPGGPDATARQSSPYAASLSDAQRDILNPPSPPGLTF